MYALVRLLRMRKEAEEWSLIGGDSPSLLLPIPTLHSPAAVLPPCTAATGTRGPVAAVAWRLGAGPASYRSGTAGGNDPRWQAEGGRARAAPSGRGGRRLSVRTCDSVGVGQKTEGLDSG